MSFFFRTTLNGRRINSVLTCKLPPCPPIGATAPPEPAHGRSTTENLVATNPQRVPNPNFLIPGGVAEARGHHKDALLSSFSGPTTCRWPNCSSLRVFKDRYTLSEHITNIHVSPLCCSITGCSVGPFGKRSDVNRHVASIHSKSGFFCPIESCQSMTTGFPRKDKLVKHMREVHDNVRCSLNHCGAVILDGQQEAHVRDCHGDWECALRACKHGLPSHFTLKAARLHLTKVHKIYPATASNLLSWAEIYSADHIVHLGVVRILRTKLSAECQGCLELAPKPK